ncbi:hypothetical protein [Parapedobacter soli]|uniref:hypothetical protein n=1 Tax=Parapedobacter soli TaxID=416955 RepID=UPI0021C5A25D|nr:hypothetical protein [Parapedobacter soli]
MKLDRQYTSILKAAISKIRTVSITIAGSFVFPLVFLHTSFSFGAEYAALASADVTFGADHPQFTGTYYVDDTEGDDGLDGTSPNTAWQSLHKINNTLFGPGARILFKSGGV